MMSAVGRKNSSAASTQRLREEVPLWAAAAIQRGPRTAAMLNSSTSQNPISRRSSDRASFPDVGLLIAGAPPPQPDNVSNAAEASRVANGTRNQSGQRVGWLRAAPYFCRGGGCVACCLLGTVLLAAGRRCRSSLV